MKNIGKKQRKQREKVQKQLTERKLLSCLKIWISLSGERKITLLFSESWLILHLALFKQINDHYLLVAESSPIAFIASSSLSFISQMASVTKSKCVCSCLLTSGVMSGSAQSKTDWQLWNNKRQQIETYNINMEPLLLNTICLCLFAYLKEIDVILTE